MPELLPAPLARVLERAPLVLVDAGARGGPPPIWRTLAPFTHWIAFEPDPDAAAALRSSTLPRETTVIAVALNDRPGHLTLNVTRDGGDSSRFLPNDAFLGRFPRAERFDVIGTLTVEADTLDRQLAALQVASVDALKLDTQGSELAILKGGARTLANGVFAVDVEVELNPIYASQPLLGDIDACLRPSGFELFDLRPRYWKHTSGQHLALPRGQIVWADALYLSALPAFIERVRHAADPEAVVARAIAIAMAYGHADYAYALLDAVTEHLDDTLPLRGVVRALDAAADTPIVTTIPLDASQVRTLHAIERRDGTKVNRQIRRAIDRWIADQQATASPAGQEPL